MAISDAQIRAVLAANPNASQAQIEKALAKYGVTPRQFLMATGVDPAIYAGNTRAADEVYTPVYTPPPPAPTPAPMATPAPVAPVAPVAAPAPVYTPAPVAPPVAAPAPVYTPYTPAPVAPPVAAPVAPPVSAPAPVTNEQIRAALAGNPNASQAQIEKAMAKYGVTPREFLMATGLDPARYAGNTPAAGEVYTPVYTPPTPATVTTPAAANTPVSPQDVAPPENGLTGTTSNQITDEQIRAALAANPNASPDKIAKAMANYKVTPDQLAQAVGSGVSDVAGSSGAGDTYTDAQINDILAKRFLESGPLSAEDVNRAGIRYGISPEQMARINPNLMEQTAGLKPAMDTLSDVGDTLRTDLGTMQGTTERLYGEAQGYQAPYREYGQQAAQRQAALTGALGPEAQQAAFAEYQQSPALDFLQSQSERALTRNAAAMGGIGGGNVRQDLTKLTADLYGQDFQNQFNRLGDIATRGYGASGTSAQLGGQQAGLMAQTALPVYSNIAGYGAQGAGYQMQTGRDMSQNIGQTGINMANTQTGNAAAQAKILNNLSAENLSYYNQLSSAFGENVANQFLATAQANQNMGANLSGVPGQTFTPVPGYDIGGAIGAGGRAWDLGNIMFPGQQPVSNPQGNMVMQSSVNPIPPPQGNMVMQSAGGVPAAQATNPNQNINFGGFTTNGLLKFT